MSSLQRINGLVLLQLLLLLLLLQMQNVTHAERDNVPTSDDAAPTLELPHPLMQTGATGPHHQRTAFDTDDGDGDGENDIQTSGHVITTSSHRQGRRKLPVKRTPRPTLMDIALEASAREGLNAMAELYGRLELDIMQHGRVLEANHPAALLSKFSAPVEGTEQREMAAYATITATKAFRRNYKNYNELARQSHTQKISLRRTALEALCPPREPPLCMPAAERYRTHDGTCNNKRHPRWGAAQMPFNRFLPPEYGDGVDSVRDATEGGPLSSSRFVSLLVHGAKDGDAPLTLMTAQWGQLLDHDLTSTAQPRAINGSVPSCCGRKDFHPSCFPIKVPLDDPWLAPLKVRCLEFLRSAPAQRRDCVLSWREQTNQATSYIDASPIYSNSAKSSDNARVFRNGLLVFGRGNPTEDVCQRGAIATQCIRSGDGRSGEQPGLLALHHVWVGEHNRIALQLSEMNPHWSDEKLYQEARRIVGAMFQHITYREFLPIILGREVCKLFDLELLPTGYYLGYNSKVNPTVANSFAAAAFRFGHSLVQNSYLRCDRHHNILSNNVSLHEEFQRGDIGSAGSLHRLLRGLATQRALKRDEFITPELTNHLFQTPGFPFGLDLAAINIQRGRDHGTAPYTAWRVPCGLTAINDWEDFVNVVGPESAQRIAHAYRSVHDIDLFVGGISERPVVGGLVGPTFACIIAQQFSNSRKGDRFWYENGGFENSFTPAQLHSIRRVSLAQVLCRAVGGGTFQPNIFIPADFEGNERLPCGNDLLAPIDLDPWLEIDPFNADAEPEQVFDIVHQSNIENKADFTTRVDESTPPSTHTPHVKVPPTQRPHVPHVNFIPNASSGFQRPSVMSSTAAPQKINDKLDFKRKNQITNRPSTRPNNKPLNGVNNKLDKKGTRITLNIKNVNRHRLPTTTRRTVILNNLAVELRTVDNLNDSDKTKKKNSTMTALTKSKTKKKTTNANKTHTTGKPLDEPEGRTTEHIISDNSTKTAEKLDEPEGRTKDNTISDNSTKTTEKLDEPEGRTEENIIPNNSTKTTEKLDQPEGQTKKHIISDNSTKIALQLGNDTTITRTGETRLNKLAESKTGVNNLIDFSEIVQNDQTNMTNTTHTIVTNKTNTKTITTTTTTTKVEVIKDVTDIDPLKHASAEGHKRVQRQQKSETNANNLTSNYTSRTAITSVNRKSTKTNNNIRTNLTNIINISKLQHKVNKTLNSGKGVNANYLSATIRNLYPAETRFTLTIPTTKLPKQSKTTNRNVELRQYQTRPIYTRPQNQPPHKVIVDGPNADQYEIEINIRQTNKGPAALRPSTAYTTQTNGYQSVNTINHIDYPSTTPAYIQYYQPSSITASPSQGYLSHTKRTKPPTIIYLNEHDERTTTTRPNLFQNFITFASNGFSPSPSNRPQSNKEPINYESSLGVGGISGGSPHSSNVQYNSHQPTQTAPTLASSFSQVGGVGSGGIVHASAISAGNFGSIVGVASANGADSTFSFNIRPRPDRPDAGTYGLLPPRKSSSSSFEYVNVPPHSSQVLTHQSNTLPNKEEYSNSPFSTAHRPSQQALGYYSRTTNVVTSEQSKKQPLHIAILENESKPDYDYQGKALQSKHVSNLTFSAEDENDNPPTTEQIDFDDYTNYYDDDEGDGDNVTPADRYNRDGYLRPQLMLGNLFRRAEAKDRNALVNVTKLDDNYVLPAMNSNNANFYHSTETLKDILNMLNITTDKITDFPDTFGKQLSNDILAEADYDEDENDTTEMFLATKSAAMNSITNNNETETNDKIAFAPITLLTKPERPDNWVIYELPEDKPLLPRIPDVSKEEESEHTIEIPMPIRSSSKTWPIAEFGKPTIEAVVSNDNGIPEAMDNNIETEIDTTDNPNSDTTTTRPETDVATETIPTLTTTLEPDIITDVTDHDQIDITTTTTTRTLKQQT